MSGETGASPYSLQINRVHEYLVKNHETLKEWWFDLKNDRVKRDRSYYLQGMDDILSETEKDVILQTDVETQSEDAVLNDIAVIRDTIGDVPIVLVSHFDILTEDGREIPLRINLAKYVRKGAKASRCMFFNPKDAIEFYGRQRALEDMAHYTQGFEHFLGKNLYRHFICKL